MPAKVFLSVFMLAFLLTAPASSADYHFSKEIVDTLESSRDANLKRAVQPRVNGLSISELALSMENQATGSKMNLEIYYPQGTGQARADQWLKTRAEKKLAEYQVEVKKLLAEKRAYSGWKSMIFLATRPSARYLSVIFYESDFSAGSSRPGRYEIVTFDLQTGRPLAIGDVFHKPGHEGGRSLGFFANYVNAALDKRCFELHKPSLCRPSSVSLDSAAGGLKNLAFTPQGLAVIYGSHDGSHDRGGFGRGTEFIDIPKADLMAWGLPGQFWK